MSHFTVYPIVHDVNYFEVFSILLQVSMERVTSTKALQQKVLQADNVKTPSDLLSFININEKGMQSYLRSEKQRIEKELALLEMLVCNKTKNTQHMMSFYHLSLKIINQWYPSFQVRVNLSGEYIDVVELYAKFFLLSGMSHRYQQINAIKKNNLYEKVPFLSLLMKWLQEFCRLQFSKYFTALYDSITKTKATYAQLKQQSDVALSPRVQRIPESNSPDKKGPRPFSCKLRSTSGYNKAPDVRRSSQIVSQQQIRKKGVINKNITIRDFRNYLQPVMDVMDIELSHFEQSFFLSKRLTQASRTQQQATNQTTLLNNMLQRNGHVLQTQEQFKNKGRRPPLSFYSPQWQRPQCADFFNQ